MKKNFAKKLLVLLLITFILTTVFSNQGAINKASVDSKTNAVKMISIEKGTFMMGATRDDTYTLEWEKPIHKVTLDYDFLMGQYELTNEEFLKFLNDSNVDSEGNYNEHLVINTKSKYCQFAYNKGKFQLKDSEKTNYPVTEVTWWGAIEYCNWLSQQNNLSAAYDKKGNLLDKEGNQTNNITQVEGFRLPTEAEWEYAARGAENDNNTSGDYKYAGSNHLDEVGWYADNSLGNPLEVTEGILGLHEVGLKKPNEIGLYDMSGNVWEWCHDCWSENYYATSPEENPVNLKKTNPYRVTRGGGWTNVSVYCRTVARGYGKPIGSIATLGFRIAKTK